MAYSDTQIVNMALTGIGEARIVSLDQDQETARQVKAIYEPVRDEVLSTYPWKFALKSRQIAKLDTAPLFTYDNAFQIPSDSLRVVKTDLDENGLIWDREGETIVTNETAVKIQYIQRITDATKFTASFVTALAARLEAELAYSVSNNATLGKEKLEIYFKSKLPLSKSIDAQEGNAHLTFQTDGFMDARSTGQI